MADLPISLDPALTVQLRRAFDAEGKIMRTVAALGPLDGSDVALLGGGPTRAAEMAELGARVTTLDWNATGGLASPDAAFDVVVSCWSGLGAPDPRQVREVDRVLRPTGRFIVVHDYGRDHVSRLRGDRPEYGAWSRRDGPFLRNGFRIRVVHCWWTFESLEAARSFLTAAFGQPGMDLADSLRRPRLSYNVAVYHRARTAPDSIVAVAEGPRESTRPATLTADEPPRPGRTASEGGASRAR